MVPLAGRRQIAPGRAAGVAEVESPAPPSPQPSAEADAETLKPPAADRPGRGPFGSSARLPLFAAVLSLASSGALLLIARALLPAHKSLGGVLMGWDASWYEQIALHGYAWNPHSHLQQNVNFFPVYPAFERVGHLLTGLSIQDVAVGSSIVFQAIAAALLVLIVRGEGATGRQSLAFVAMFLVSPPVVFDLMGYYSALFCVLTFLALLFAQRRQRWLVAAVLGVASGTNPIGIAFAGAFVLWSLIELISSKSLNWRSLGVLAAQAVVSVSGIIAYACLLLVRFGDPLAFYRAAKAWSRPLPLSTAVERIVSLEPVRTAFTQWAALPYGWNQNFAIDAIAAVMILALIVALVGRRGSAKSFGFWLIVAAFLIVQFQSARWGSEIGATRYLLPAGLAVGAVEPVRRLLTRPAVFVALIVLMLGGTTVFLEHLVTGQWI